MTYQLYIAELNGTKPDAAMTIGQAQTKSFIFAPDNTDYQQFKRDIQNGVVLNDATGNPVTGDALAAFIGTLP
jgi:hypothetical protein